MRLSRETNQKKILESEISRINSFFTAEELFEKIKKKNSSIGIATIYRFLKDLKAKRKIHTYVCDRRVLYSRANSSHCHFICEKCNKTVHFQVDNIDFLKNKLKSKASSICHFQIDVQGICEDCGSCEE